MDLSLCDVDDLPPNPISQSEKESGEEEPMDFEEEEDANGEEPIDCEETCSGNKG